MIDAIKLVQYRDKVILQEVNETLCRDGHPFIQDLDTQQPAHANSRYCRVPRSKVSKSADGNKECLFDCTQTNVICVYPAEINIPI